MMGREVRRVPKDWEHPRDRNGKYLPMYEEDFETEAAKWKEEFKKWVRTDIEYWEYRSPPNRYYYVPKSEKEKTHYQMYETVSEGTPISPVMDSPESLARWLVDNEARMFASCTATYNEWLYICKGGWAADAVFINGILVPGVRDLDIEKELSDIDKKIQ